jgi:hypothetical protein
MGKAYQFYDPMRTREFQQGYYIRDNWQVSHKLSVNLGMRFEHFPIMNRGEFGIERYDAETNKVLIGGRGNIPRDAGTQAIAVMFAPRVGLAYRMRDKTVLRAGFGITDDPYPVSRPLRSPYPAVISDEYQQVNSFVPVGSLATGIPAVKFPDLSTGILDIPNNISTNSLQAGKFRRGYIESFNFTVQHDLGANFVLQTGYVGTRSIRQAVTYFEANAGLIPGLGVNGRPLYGKFGVTTSRSFFIPMSTQRYDAWQSNLMRRFTAGLFLTSSFTWSKSIGINAGNSDSGLRFYVPSEFASNRSVSDFDRTLSWVTGANYELPFGRNKTLAKTGPAAAVLGGWQLNPNVALYTGRPFIVTTDGSSLNAPQNTQVADQIKGDVQKLGGVGLGSPFYDPSAFAQVKDVRFGNMGLNALRGPRLFNTNLGLFRKFQVSERIDLQFRAEALNLTNTPTLNQPNATVSTPDNFMRVTSTVSTATSPQRTLRFGLRAAF